ncbi:MAG: hypothetical protein PHU63_03050 [Candidatus ainarchaeum sp.]|nr:hypothetical protein [Candidatus ainarchaeum sp.]
MENCAKCGISGEKTRLFDVVSKDGIVKLCNRCILEEGLPVIKRPTTTQIKDSEVQQTFLQRVREFNKLPGTKTPVREDVSLREIVDRNFKMTMKESTKPRPDLLENFHWIIMRERRSKHISREQFAKDLGESEALIKMIEQGILPENDNLIINKIESYLKIKLRKPEFRIEAPKRDLTFDSASVSNLTISDLQNMKSQKEGFFMNTGEIWEEDIEGGTPFGERMPEKKKSKGWNLFKKKPKEEPEQPTGKDKELSQEEIDDLIFGRKA